MMILDVGYGNIHAEYEKGGGRPSLSSQVADAIKAQIEAGYYAPGDKLPTEPALIDKFGFSRTVVRRRLRRSGPMAWWSRGRGRASS